MLTLAILNHLIAQQVEAKAQWQQYQNRVLTWALPMTALHGRIDADGFWQADTAEAEVVITVPAATLIKMMTQQPVGVGDVILQGDQQLGMAVLPLLQHLRYDWRDDLARLCGDMAGGALANQLDQCLTDVKAVKDNIKTQIMDYVAEEDAAVLGRNAFIHFRQQISQLRDDEARLNQRLTRLEQFLKS